MEYTAPNTPQQNGVVERSFATDLRRVYASMIQAGLTKSYINKLWPQAVRAQQRVSNITPNKNNKENACPDKLYYGKEPTLYPYLQQFGRVGFVTIRKKLQKKLVKKSMRCVMVGYAENHANDTYMMFNPRTNRIILSRDIRWADFDRPTPQEGMGMFKNKCNTSEDDQEFLATSSDDDSEVNQHDDLKSPKVIYESDNSDEETKSSEISNQGGKEHADSDSTSKTMTTPKSKLEERIRKKQRMMRAMKKLGTSYNPDANKHIDRLQEITHYVNLDGESVKVVQETHFVHNTAVTSDPGEPKTINEALSEKNRHLWEPSAKAEIENFLKRQSWEFVDKDIAIKANRKIIPLKWVFKIKNEQDGTKRYKTRLCVKGFHQVPGVDYTESFSPVATESTIHLVIAYTLYKYNEGWRCEMFDVEAAFLNAELENPMYLQWPDKMMELGFINQDQMQNQCIKLVRSMYGNVDAALRWQRCFVEVCTMDKGEIKLKQSQVDPCLLYKQDKDGKLVLIVVMYVDDVMVSGMPDMIRWFMTEFKKKFNITEMGQMKKHLGIWYDWKRDTNGEPYVVARMDEMIDEIVEKYEAATNAKTKVYDTPGAPGKNLKKNEDESNIIQETDYRSIMGKVLYYVNKMDLPCANATRELSQHLSSPDESHWKALGRLIGYIKTRKNKGKIIRKPQELRVVAWCDSDYAKAEERKSITGGISTIGGTPIYGCSKGQACVCLSSSDSEYVALSMMAQEVRFEQQLLDELDPKEHQYPSVIFEDNIGAIYLVKNKQVGQRTKHIDVRRHFIRSLADKKLLVVHFTPSEENRADICTKNVSAKLFEQHAPHIYNGRIEYQIDKTKELKHEVTAIDKNQKYLPDMIKNEVDKPQEERVMVIHGTHFDEEESLEEIDWDDVNSSDLSVEIIYPPENQEITREYQSNTDADQERRDREFVEMWNKQQKDMNDLDQWLKQTRRSLNTNDQQFRRSPLEMRGPLEATLPDIKEIRQYIMSMVLTGRDYRTKPKFIRELKREIEYRSNRAVAEINAIMEIDYPSDDAADSDYSYYEFTTDDEEYEMVYATVDDEMELSTHSNKSTCTMTYNMPDIYDKLNSLDGKLKTTLEKLDKLIVYGDDMEEMMNSNYTEEESRNEIVDRYFLHLDVAIAKQNTEILQVRDKLLYEIIRLKVDVERMMEKVKVENNKMTELINKFKKIFMTETESTK